nr:transferase, chloramphenicol acetyltransferase-like domain protein [Tanacetum cinerariifolium]
MFVKKLEESMEKTLTLLYPLAGRYMEHIRTVDCNDQGVDFVQAQADITIQEILDPKMDPMLINDFIPSKRCVTNQTNDAMLATQITTLKCGGLALGISMAHRICDASTMTNFLNQWATFSQRDTNVEPSVVDFTSSSFFPAQVKVQVSKILPKIEQTVNEQLEAEVLSRSSNSSKTSYVVVADLSEMELKKILIDKIEGNKSIHRSNEQRNLYKALVEAYKSDKIILDPYVDTVMLKRRRDDDADKDKEPSVGPDRGSKRHREGNEHKSASAPKEKATRSVGKSTQGSKSRQTLVSESATAEEPMQTTFKMEENSHPEFETSADDQPIVEPSQDPEWFSQQKKPPTLDRD